MHDTGDVGAGRGREVDRRADHVGWGGKPLEWHGVENRFFTLLFNCDFHHLAAEHARRDDVNGDGEWCEVAREVPAQVVQRCL